MDFDLIFKLLAIVGIPAFIWAWRLQILVTRLETKQIMKLEKLNQIDNRLCNVEKTLNEINGTLKEHLRLKRI